MKLKKVILVCFFIPTFMFSQSEIKYSNVHTEVLNSNSVLCTNLLNPNQEFYLGIYTEGWIVEDLTEEQCGDIKTDSIKNLKIIKLLESKKLLEKLYVLTDSNEYESINSTDKFEWKKEKLIIVLSFANDWNKLNQVYIPINNKKEAKEIITSISKNFNSDNCFKKFKREL